MAQAALKESNRRGFLLSAGAAGLLAACGAGTIESALKPGRVIGFGDGFSDVGQTGNRFTVNDGTVNIWSALIAANYGLTLTAQSAGGNGYAMGNARVVGTPDAAGKTTTLSIKQQIDKFLSVDKFGATDLVILNGGISDIIYEMARVLGSGLSSAGMIANVAQAGVDFAAQIQRLVQAGAKYVLMTGSYNLGRSPWATAIGQSVLLTAAAGKFNEQLLVNTVDLGANVLYADAAYYYNLITASPASYTLTDATTLACNSVDPGTGIGIGLGQVASPLCTTTTVNTGLDYTKLTFADQVYFTPAAQVLFGNYAYTRLRARW